MYKPYLDKSSIMLCLPALPYYLLSNLNEVLTRFGELRETKPKLKCVVQLWVCHWGKGYKKPITRPAQYASNLTSHATTLTYTWM